MFKELKSYILSGVAFIIAIIASSIMTSCEDDAPTLYGPGPGVDSTFVNDNTETENE